MTDNYNKRKRQILIVSLICVCVVFCCIGCCMAAHSDEPETGTEIDLSRLEEVIVPRVLPSEKKTYIGFTVDFNEENHTPNCVSWTLLDNETSGGAARYNKFWCDSDLKGCPDTKDYSNSGYDRGHLCPAADQKWSDEAMRHCFVMANMCPQKHELNSGAWKTLEDKERVWANRDGILVIAAGPIYSDDDTQRIGRIGVRVPSAFFKVFLAPYATPMRAIGFIYPNTAAPGNMENYSCTVDEVERITGLDFFSSLPDEIENEVESVASFKEWNSNRK